jgi:hypothetical protein
MLDMPFPCKIERDYSSEATVNVLSSGAGKAAEVTVSIQPNALGEIVSLTWVNLSYENVIGLEYWLLRSKATERFLWNNEVYLLEDEYTVEVNNNKPIVKASFRRVA